MADVSSIASSVPGPGRDGNQAAPSWARIVNSERGFEAKAASAAATTASATVVELPSLSWLHSDQAKALRGIIKLVDELVADLEANGEPIQWGAVPMSERPAGCLPLWP